MFWPLLPLLLQQAICLNRTTEFQRYDGRFNNLANPGWGTTGSRMYRDDPPNYSDGVYLMDLTLPSARAVSNLIFKGESGRPNRRNMTTMFTFFSQVVEFEIISTTQVSCPLEKVSIPVPKCDKVFDGNCKGNQKMPYNRANYDGSTGHGLNAPREQTNGQTAWIDASLVYSTEGPWVAAQRAFINGRFLEDEHGNPPKNKNVPLNNPVPPQVHQGMSPDRLYALGDSRVNENPGLLSFGILLYRLHNRQASLIKRANPDWNDENIFQAARRWVIAILQKIIFYDFLPVLINKEVPPYVKYDKHISPNISPAFSPGAYNFFVTMTPSGMLMRKIGDECNFREDIESYPAIRLCQNWWNAQDIISHYSVEEVILGMASQITEDIDTIVVEDWRDFWWGPLHFSRGDVVSTLIMKGRDFGQSSYNQMRHAFDLPPRTWETINPSLYAKNKTLFDQLAALYGNKIHLLDAYVGGMLEVGDDGAPGELFQAIILDQFVRLRNSDRFWFENRLNGLFTDEELAQIRNTTLRDIIRDTTGIPDHLLQENVFFWRDGDPCPQPFQVNTTGLEKCVPNMKYDYFSGNDAAYVFTLILLACTPVVCVLFGCYLSQRRISIGWDSSFDTVSMVAPMTLSDQKKFRMPAFEWLEETHIRQVVVEFEPGNLLVKKPSGAILRKVIFPRDCELLVTHSEPESSTMFGPYCLITLPKTYDLVLRLPSDKHLSVFLAHLKESMAAISASVSISSESNPNLLDKAETKGRRQNRLDTFFREAYARAFNVPEMSNTNSPTPGESSVMEDSISQFELAQAMGMREEDLFVKRMFALCHKQEGDELSFTEFLDILKTFVQGSSREKYNFIFNMLDIEHRGTVNKKELITFIKSLNKTAGVHMDDQQQDRIVELLLKRSGVKSEFITKKDFEAVFEGVDKDQPLTMHIKGQRLTAGVDPDRVSLKSFCLPPTDPSFLLNINLFTQISGSLETYRQHIFIMFIFVLVNIIFFVNRFWLFLFLSDTNDARRVMGVGLAIARGSAEALCFCMAVLLLTVCRNIITLIREWPIGEYIPFDAAIAFHKIVALFALFWATLHAIAHCVNFYHLTTQSPTGLHCTFHETIFGPNYLPSIEFWFFGTITGLTGLVLVMVMSIIYVFAIPFFIRYARQAFRLAHLFIYPYYALTILHGLPKLFASPRFLYFVFVPICIFIIDRIMGMRQKYKNLKIFKAALLPSDIIYIMFERPASFIYQSGQWLRISSPAFSVQFNEQHAFSIASAPQVPTLELYIKAVGPWTWKLRSEILKAQATNSPYPLIHLQGPYGDGNQEWRSYDVAVLVGAGIGVTPYASTLTDLVLEVRSGRHHNVKCKKVYFLWVCPSHKSYEWFVDVLREIEGDEGEPLLETHIFVTQFFHKYDLRTTMLYICEKHFRGDHAGVSMFTGLRAHNHFGRPNFDAFFKFIQNRHNEVSDVGVFSCGPATINEQVGAACARANRARNAPSLQHRFETF